MTESLIFYLFLWVISAPGSTRLLLALALAASEAAKTVQPFSRLVFTLLVSVQFMKWWILANANKN